MGKGQPCSESQAVPKIWHCSSTGPLVSRLPSPQVQGPYKSSKPVQQRSKKGILPAFPSVLPRQSTQPISSACCHFCTDRQSGWATSLSKCVQGGTVILSTARSLCQKIVSEPEKLSSTDLRWSPAWTISMHRSYFIFI